MMNSEDLCHVYMRRPAWVQAIPYPIPRCRAAWSWSTRSSAGDQLPCSFSWRRGWYPPSWTPCADTCRLCSKRWLTAMTLYPVSPHSQGVRQLWGAPQLRLPSASCRYRVFILYPIRPNHMGYTHPARDQLHMMEFDTFGGSSWVISWLPSHGYLKIGQCGPPQIHVITTMLAICIGSSVLTQGIGC